MKFDRIALTHSRNNDSFILRNQNNTFFLTKFLLSQSFIFIFYIKWKNNEKIRRFFFVFNFLIFWPHGKIKNTISLLLAFEIETGSWGGSRGEAGETGGACSCTCGGRIGRGRTASWQRYGQEPVRFLLSQLWNICRPREGQRWQQQGAYVHTQRRIGVGERNAKTNTFSYCI